MLQYIKQKNNDITKKIFQYVTSHPRKKYSIKCIGRQAIQLAHLLPWRAKFDRELGP